MLETPPKLPEGTGSPDAHLRHLVHQVQAITRTWAERHELWMGDCFEEASRHWDDEPGSDTPITLLCADAGMSTALAWDGDEAAELRSSLERIGVFLELQDSETAAFHFIDPNSDLCKEFDRYAHWNWTCRLIEGDCADVDGDLYRHFAERPDDLHRLPPREFEKLVSSIFAARGWRTELGPGSGDGGVDLRIWQTDPLGDLLTLVQIKRYAANRAIGLQAVQALAACVDREFANRGLFVTSSRFLPGVHAFAERSQHRLLLADGANIQEWCAAAAQEAKAARNRALAMESFLPLIDELRARTSHPRLLVGGLRTPSFCVVLKETRSAALLAHIPSLRISGDAWRGEMVPVLDGQTIGDEHMPTVFRASRTEEKGNVRYWGQRTLYSPWDGRPGRYEHWD